MPCSSLISAASILSLAISPATQPTQNQAPDPPPDMVQANATVQGFVQALRDSDWTKAIGYCSAKVAGDAKAYPSPGAFFRDVVPIKPLVVQTRNPIYFPSENPGKGGPWSMYGLACRVAELKPDPADRWEVMVFREVWWQGQIQKAEDGRRMIDFPTTPLKTHIEKRLAEMKSIRDKAIATESELEPKLKDLHTRLTPLARRYQAGGPMLFRLELVNDGPAKLIYDRSRTGVNDSMTVKDSQGKPVPYTGGPVQTGMNHEIINPGETVVLLREWDLARQYGLKALGRYSVQFSGRIPIAEPDPHKTLRIDRGAKEIETLPAAGKRSLRRFASNIVEIEVVTSQTLNNPRGAR